MIPVRLTARAEGQRAVLATLPNRFRITERAAAATAIAGDEPAPEGALLVTEPGLLRPETLERWIEQQRTVVLGLSVAGALSDAARRAVAARADDVPAMVEISAETIGSLRAASFEALMLLSAMGVRIAGIRTLAKTAGQLVLAVSAAEWRGIRLDVRHSFRMRYRLHTASPDLRRELIVSPEPHAAPADVRWFDDEGTHAGMPFYQGGLRAAWINLHAALQMKSSDRAGLIETARVLRLLERALA